MIRCRQPNRDRHVELNAKDLIDRLGGDVEEEAVVTKVAAALDVGLSTFYRYLNGGDAGKSKLPARLLGPLAEMLGPELGAELLEEAVGEGFAVVPVDAPVAEAGEATLGHCVRAITAAANLIARASAATADGRVSPEAAREIMDQARECSRFAHVLIRSCGHLLRGGE